MLVNPIVDQINTIIRSRLHQFLNAQSVTDPHIRTLQYSDLPDLPTAPLESSETGIASKIDHTLLKSDATSDEIARICNEARENHFATVCVNPTFVKLATELLQGSSTQVITVVGFPLGATSTATKVFEAQEAIRSGAREIDMVIHVGSLKAREYTRVLEDIRQVVVVSHPHPVKVILETSILDHEQKIIGCALAKAAGAKFVKTSTGFGEGGATEEDIQLMRRIGGPEVGVKASGGIRSFADAQRMIQAGANRIGTSAGVTIVAQEKVAQAILENHPKESHVGLQSEIFPSPESQVQKKNSLY